MREDTSTQMVRCMSQSTRVRRIDGAEKATGMAAVIGWSVIGLALGLIETVGPPDIAVGVAEMLAVFGSVCAAALAGIVAADLRAQR